MTSGFTSRRGVQFAVQVAQVFLVGLAAGMTRTVAPALAVEEFGLSPGAVEFVAAMVIGFGLAKAAMNLVAGAWSDRRGRRRVLLAGWLATAPVAPMIALAPSWGWIVAALALLGVGQGLTWSMTLAAKLDITRPERRGMVNGVNEFAGYAAVALAGVFTAALAERWGGRGAILAFGLAVSAAGIALTTALVRDVGPIADAEVPDAGSAQPTRAALALRLTLRSRRLLAVCQAGLIEKFADALVWTMMPAYLRAQGFGVGEIARVVGAYALTWGVCQAFTGPLSDRVGRAPLIAGGMALCGVGLTLFPEGGSFEWRAGCAAAAGLGMAMLYPTLGAAAADQTSPGTRGAVLGAYRFWRDLGYAVGGAALVLTWAHAPESRVFPVVGACLCLSAAAYLALMRSGRAAPAE